MVDIVDASVGDDCNGGGGCSEVCNCWVVGGGGGVVRTLPAAFAADDVASAGSTPRGPSGIFAFDLGVRNKASIWRCNAWPIGLTPPMFEIFLAAKLFFCHGLAGSTLS